MAITQQDAQMLADAIVKSLKGNSQYQSSNSAFASYKSDSKLDIKQLEQIVKNNGDIAKQFGTMLRNLTQRGTALEGVYKELEKLTRNQSETTRKSALAFADLLEVVRKGAKGAGDEYDKMIATLKFVNATTTQVVANMKDMGKTLSNFDALTAKSAKMTAEKTEREAQYIKKIAEAQDELDNARKNKKSTVTAKTNLKKAQDDFDDFLIFHSKNNKILDETNKSLNEVSAQFDNIIETLEDYNKITDVLTDEEMQQVKNIKALNAEQRKILLDKVNTKVGESAKGLHLSMNGAASGITKSADKMGNAFSKAGEYSLKFGKLLVNLIPGLVSDMQSRLRFNVNTTGYLSGIAHGFSEQERAEIIGTNRIGLRGLGAGNAELGFSNTRELQNTAHIFGAIGAEAIQKALAYQQTGIGMGISTSNATGTMTQMKFMHKFSEQVGMTDDQLKDFYDSLTAMGEMSNEVQSLQNKSEEERQKIVNNEIAQRTKLNTVLGMSIEQQKQAAQAIVNSKFSTIESSIKAQVSMQMYIQQFNKANPNNRIDSRTAKILQNTANAAGTTDLVQMQGIIGKNTGLSESERQRIAKTLTDIYVSDNNRIKSAQDAFIASGNTTGRAASAYQNQQVVTQLQSALGSNRAQNAIEATIEATRAKAIGPNAVGKESFDSIWGAAEKVGNGLSKLDEAVLRTTEVFTGLNKSFGGGASGLLSGIVSNAFGYLAGKGIIKVGGSILGRVAGGTAGAAAEGGMLASATSLLKLALPAITVTAAAVAGTLAGRFIYSKMENNITGRVAGFQVASIMAELGNEKAQQAIKQDIISGQVQKTGDTRRAQLKAVIDAQKLAGTTRSDTDIQKAIGLTKQYKSLYNVNISSEYAHYSDTLKAATYSPNQAIAQSAKEQLAAMSSSETQQQQNTNALLKATQETANNTKVTADKAKDDKNKDMNNAATTDSAYVAHLRQLAASNYSF